MLVAAHQEFTETGWASDESAAALLDGPEAEALERARAWLRVPEGPFDRRGCLLAVMSVEVV